MKTIRAIASKSDAHRALISAALSEGQCDVICNTTSEDIEATKECLSALKNGKREMHCKESGSTFRFLLPVMGALGYDADFYPEGRLPERPLSPLYEEMIRMGCSLSPIGKVPFKVRGHLKGGEYFIAGNVSSQYISGLLFALPLLKENSIIKINGILQSEDYVKMTVSTLNKFGIKIERTEEGFFIEGNQHYKAPKEYIVEGDWSNAAFILVAGVLTDEGIAVKGLNINSIQGDKRIIDVMKKFGADITVSEDIIKVEKGELRGIEIDAGQIPDMVPAISVLATASKGETKIFNAERLRLKESDRLKSITSVIKNLGGDIEELKDGLVIKGTGRIRGGTASSYGDHRIAMMAACLSLISEEKVKIIKSDSVKKSYPDFFNDFHKLKLDKNIERA